VCKFDVTSIPSNSTVSSATLDLYVSTRELNGTANLMQLYALTQAWDEQGVTWQRRTASQTWTGGGALGSQLSTLAFPGGTGWISLTVPAATVQSWINNAATNNGLLIKCSDEIHGSVLKENFLRIVGVRTGARTVHSTFTVAGIWMMCG